MLLPGLGDCCFSYSCTEKLLLEAGKVAVIHLLDRHGFVSLTLQLGEVMLNAM